MFDIVPQFLQSTTLSSLFIVICSSHSSSGQTTYPLHTEFSTFCLSCKDSNLISPFPSGMSIISKKLIFDIVPQFLQSTTSSSEYTKIRSVHSSSGQTTYPLHTEF